MKTKTQDTKKAIEVPWEVDDISFFTGVIVGIVVAIVMACAYFVFVDITPFKVMLSPVGTFVETKS